VRVNRGAESLADHLAYEVLDGDVAVTRSRTPFSVI
jgi:hypothetical protein